MSVRKMPFILVILACVALAQPALAQGATLVELDDIKPEKLFLAGFALDREEEVEIEAAGFRYRNKGSRSSTSPAWILDSKTRDVVWSTSDGERDKASRHLYEYKDKVSLPAGRYEVYYSSYPQPWEGWRVDGLGDFISRIVRSDMDGWDEDDYDDACPDFFIKVSGEGRTLAADEIMAALEISRDEALISAVQLKDNHYESFGLTLDREMDLEIYAVGEANKDGAFDCSWIIDTETRERVWQFDYGHSDRAGGAKKNRRNRQVLTLPAGSYALFCVTDDSHHFGDWNSAPPDDPFHWGVTVRAADPAMARHASVGEYENIKSEDVLLELVGLGDSEHEHAGFTLKRDMKLRVYAIGEGDEDDMFDTSWIIDADTRETVWEMKYRRSEHAGGARKNRVVDEILELDSGDYIAYAVTDGSHAYSEWNASPPYDKKRYGLTLAVAEGDKGDFARFEDRDDPSVLAQIIHVGDDVHKREGFTMDRDGEVRVYALGEGQGRRMFDLAWIEDDRGRIVWEMTTRNSDHAGGAHKNLVFNDTISLDRGEYTLHYESDGSHSADGWNADPPRDRMSWGVTVKAVD